MTYQQGGEGAGVGGGNSRTHSRCGLTSLNKPRRRGAPVRAMLPAERETHTCPQGHCLHRVGPRGPKESQANQQPARGSHKSGTQTSHCTVRMGVANTNGWAGGWPGFALSEVGSCFSAPRTLLLWRHAAPELSAQIQQKPGVAVRAPGF